MSPRHTNENRAPSARGQFSDHDGKPLLAGVSNLAHLQQAADELAQAVHAGRTKPTDHFETELKQKDELIAALIQELEQAVDRLDRVERIGADRTNLSSSVITPLPAREFSGSQSSFMDNMQRMAEDWNQAQPHTLLERIESQLSAVHDLVINLNRDNLFRNHHVAGPDDHRRAGADDPPTDEKNSDDDPCGMTLEESSPTWESIKNQLLVAEPAAPTNTIVIAEEDAELLRLMTETPAPSSVDFNLATPETLKSAIEERDAYIIQLNRLMRMRNGFTIPKDWAVLANAPEQLKAQVDSLVQHLDVQVRMGEVEMSLERARLARERSHLQTEREQIEKHLRRLGLTSIAELDSISTTTSSSSDRRFMRFIGPKLK